MGPPPPEQAPRPRPEVNTGRPQGWMGSRSCRGEVGVTGRRRAEQRARGDGREDKVSESRAAQAASCAWRKVGTVSRGGGSCGGEGPPSLSLPGEGGPAPAAAASLSAPCPISSLWPTRLPPPQPAKLVPARVRGRRWRCCGRRLHDRLPTHTPPPCNGNVSGLASGSSPTPLSALLGILCFCQLRPSPLVKPNFTTS